MGGFGRPHTTFTANLLDPATYRQEHTPTFHEEHVHGSGGVTHGHPEISTEQYANEHFDPTRGEFILLNIVHLYTDAWQDLNSSVVMLPWAVLVLVQQVLQVTGSVVTTDLPLLD